MYTSCFLDPLAVRWCQSLSHNLTTFQTERQTHFYSKNVSGTRERVVVFISDAMRYEVAQQLFEKLAMDAKCTAKLTPAVSTVPSYTQLGMAALLPHVSLELQPDSTVTILGKKTVGTAARESILQAAEKKQQLHPVRPDAEYAPRRVAQLLLRQDAGVCLPQPDRCPRR